MVAADQVTKQLVVTHVARGEPVELVGYFGAHARRQELWLPVGLVVGGALGNLADRVRIGAAIDFLDPPMWPAFNLADIAIVAGVGLFVALLLESDGTGEGRAAPR